MIYLCVILLQLNTFALLFLNAATDIITVGAALISVAESGFMLYFGTPRTPAMFSIINFAGCFFGSPFLLLGQPVLFFGALRKSYLPPILCAVSYIIWINSFEEALIFYSLISCATAFVLGLVYKNSASYRLKANEVRDIQTQKNIQLSEKNKALEQSIAQEVENAASKERERIAGEMHDNAGHMLSRAILMTAALKMSVEQEDLKESLTGLEDTLKASMDSIRASVHKLREDAVSLDKVAKSCAEGFPNFETSINFSMGQDAPASVKYIFASAIRECFSNAARHSDADKIIINIEEHPAFYKLLFKDNGNPDPEFARGMGLEQIAERSKAEGGNVNFYVNNGFCVHIMLPKR